MEQIGRYRIIGELGRGAMGVVHHAIDPNIGRPVAIKTIRLDEFATADERERLRERLYREARSAGILSHPNIVTVYDVEEAGNLAYIAMEFVNGPTLERMLSSREPIAPPRVLEVLREAAAGLDFAHRKGIIHRDVKPANIMIAEDGTAKITDFGIAKLSKSEQLTQTGAILGTPNYMSPEQVQGLPVDGRTDQFSLAVIAYEMLTGEKPFAGEQLSTTVYKIVHDEPPGAERLNPSLNAKVDAALRRALAKKPDGRYASCTAFVSALEAACASAKGWSPAIRGRSLTMPTLEGVPNALIATTAELGTHRRKWWWYASAILIGSALGAAGWMAWDQDWFGIGTGTQIHEVALQELPPPTVPKPTLPPAPASASASGPEGSQQSGQTEAAPAKPEPQLPGTTASQPAAIPPTAAEDKPAPQPEARQVARVPSPPKPKTQTVSVRTAPDGARVVLDGRAETACKTPCAVTVPLGRHTLSISLDGYQQIQREIEIDEEPFEMSPVTLRAIGGTLLLTSQPSGAAIFINGTKSPDTTPAQLHLAPGRYNIAVEKDGVRRSEQVVIGEGIKRMFFTLE